MITGHNGNPGLPVGNAGVLLIDGSLPQPCKPDDANGQQQTYSVSTESNFASSWLFLMFCTRSRAIRLSMPLLRISWE